MVMVMARVRIRIRNNEPYAVFIIPNFVIMKCNRVYMIMTDGVFDVFIA